MRKTLRKMDDMLARAARHFKHDAPFGQNIGQHVRDRFAVALGGGAFAFRTHSQRRTRLQ